MAPRVAVAADRGRVYFLRVDYISTRGQAPALGFEEATLAGLAPDGGLYVPARWPTLSRDGIAALAGLSYAETAARILEPFVGDAIPSADLGGLTRAAYDEFGHAAVTPLVQLDAHHWLLELFHGPTLAFKDVALQLLGLLFERFLAGTDRRLTVVGATSGDTGSAAIEAVANRAGIDIVMLYPDGRVSEVQRRQMTTVAAANVHTLAIDGDFDECQALVKAMFNDRAFAERMGLSAVNSINWARLAAQVVYYFHAAVRLGAPDRAVAFAVPTGNFGDVFAGYVAARMGLPIERLIVATNVNDIVARALTTGDYSRGRTTPTATPSMDIQVSSNIERLLFDLHGRDAGALSGAMRGFEASGAMAIPEAVRGGANLFAAARIDGGAMADAMRWAHDRAGQVIDPHSAIALAAARAAGVPADVPVVTLATAHPAKFGDAVHDAIGVRPALPPRLAGLMDRPERIAKLPATLTAVQGFVAERSRVPA